MFRQCPRLFLLLILLSISARPAESASSEGDRLRNLERAVQQLQERNAALEKQVEKLRAKGDAFAPMYPPRNLKATAGNDHKAVFTEPTPPPVDVHPGGSEYKLTLGGYIQANFEDGDVSAFEGRFGLTALQDRFRLRRAKIILTGDFKEEVDFKVEGDFGLSDSAITALRTVNVNTGATTTVTNSNRIGFFATDIYANWHHYAEANVRVGQFKAPYGLENLTPDAQILTIERSLVNGGIAPERQLGIMLWGKPLAKVVPEQKDLLTYYVGAFNGNGRNFNNNDNNDFMYSGRLELLPFKGKIAGLESKLQLGGDYFYSRDESGTSISPSGNLKVGADGSLSAFTLTSAARRSDYSFDLLFQLGPFDLRAEYLHADIDGRLVNGVAPIADFDNGGYYVQGAYYLIPKKLQAVVKWESFDPGQVANDDISSITGGLNYYIHGDGIKLMANYIHTWSDFREAHPQFGQDQFDEMILRMQVMF